MWRFKLRSALVIFVAALGVAGAITAVNYASGGRQRVLEQIRRLGTNLLVISAEESRNVAGRARTGTIVTTLDQADYLALKREFPAYRRSSAMVTANLRLKAGFLSKASPVIGVEPAYFAMKSWPLEAGAFFDAMDIRRSRRVVLLGYRVARDLFETKSPVGERLFINRVPFTVVGVLAERGPGLGVVDEDQQVYVPLTAAMRRLMNVDYYRSIVLELPDSADLAATARAIERLMRQRHRIRPGRPDDFRVQSQTTLIETQLASTRRLGFLVRWIGFSALLVSGLGILAIAWIGVRDRTTEIGTRRALGATAGNVFFQFAFEAVVLALIGMTGGLLLGWLLSQFTAQRAGLPFVFDQTNAILALAVAFLLNLLFASWPALRAARLDPIKALKTE